MRTRQLGFTLPEITIVLGVMATLFAFATVNLAGVQRRASLTAAIDTTIADIKQQQTKAMTGSTQGVVGASSYGVHFDQNQYVYFKGSSYNASDPANVVFPLEETIQFTSVLLPGANVIFSQLSGEVFGFSAGADSLSLVNTTNSETRTIQFNKLGVVTAVN